MLRNKNVTLTFFITIDVSCVIRIIHDTSRFLLEQQKRLDKISSPFNSIKLFT